MNLNEQLGELFVEEAQETLVEFEQALLLLENLPDDDELIARLFRGVHTLKGNSRILGFDAVERFSHELENLLDMVRRHELHVTQSITDTLLLCLDVLKDLVAEVAGNGAHDAGRYADALGRLTALLSVAPKLEPDDLVFPLEPSRVAIAISQLPPRMRSSLPPAAQRSLQASAPPPKAEAAPSVVPEQPAPVPAPAPAAAPVVPSATPPNGSRAPLVAAGLDVKKERKPMSDPESSSVRVPIDKLDRLINLTGEVVIAQSIIAELVTDLSPARVSVLQEVVAQMDRHCRELQERMLGARMLPLRNVFTRFQRLVRDLASTTGKSLRLEISGEDTELDKTVIEKIADPLTHLVRNAVDHGVESSDARASAGKAAQACVRLAAYQKGGSIFIEVSDDGKGIDCAKVLAKAQASGLVRPGAQLSTDEIYALLFHPGFSTADKVTELSGRGVGMDVVKRNVEALKGSIAISSTPGQGTCFRIKLPLTLAILDGLGVRVGSEVYLVPLVVVVESLQPRATEVQRLPDAGDVVDVRGQYVPLVRLYEVFGVEPTYRQAHEGLVMVLDDGTQKIALQIDELLGQYQVVIKSLEANFQSVPGIAGATVLGDGRVALILDASNLRTLQPQRPTAVARDDLAAHLALDLSAESAA